MMRKLLISLAVTGSALAVAAPASAQVYPQQQRQQPGYGHGYGNNFGQMRNLQVRIDAIQRQIERLRDRRAISRNEANGLRAQSDWVENRLRNARQHGLNPRERQDVEMRISRLEQHVRHEVRDGNKRFGYNGNGPNQYPDRDRDGRDDRHEDDHGTHHD